MRDFLSWIFILAAFAAAAGGLYYQYEARQPCTHALPFAVGTIDSPFGVATSTVVAEAQAAAAIWNKAEGKTLLAYDPKAALKISLVYDEREAAAKLGAELASEDAQLSSERERLDGLHNALVADEAAYNKKVADVNAHGGARGSTYTELQSEQVALNTRADSLNAQAKAFNAEVNAFNVRTNGYNQTAGHTFEEGHYVQDAHGAHIEIYEFVGAVQLERVLAHELGHAIGLGHNSDPDSIMYAQNESGKLTPSAADLADLKKLCGS